MKSKVGKAGNELGMVSPELETAMTKNISKWQIVENVVAAIEQYYHSKVDAKIIQKAMVPLDGIPHKYREIDVLVQIKVGPRLLSIGIDVKNEGRPLDVTKIEQLERKWRKCSNSIDRYCVVSTSGYSEQAKTDGEKAGIELLTLDEINEAKQEDWNLALMQHRIRMANFSLCFEPLPSKQDFMLLETCLKRDNDLLESCLKSKEEFDVIMEHSSSEKKALLRFIKEGWDSILAQDNLMTRYPDGIYSYINPQEHGWKFLSFKNCRLQIPVKIIINGVWEHKFQDLKTSRFQSVFNEYMLNINSATYKGDKEALQVTSVHSSSEKGYESIQIKVGPASPKRMNIKPKF